MEDFVREVWRQLWLFSIRLLVSLLAFIVFWLLGIILDKAIRRVSARSDASRKDVLNLIANISKISLLVFGAVTALGTMGINVAALVAGLGLTGFALGFALRDALSNVLAGLLILIYRPFHRNSRISVAGFEGIVREIDLRYTTLQGEGKKYLIPNSTLFTNPITLSEDALEDLE